MDLGLTGRVAIVTGASRGLGRACAQALAAEGARTVLTARSTDDLGALAADLPAESVAVPGDLDDPELPQRLVDTALARFGRLDVLVANNGGPPKSLAVDISDADLRGALDRNLVVSVRLARAALEPMRERGWGRICMIASGSVRQPMPGLALSNTARPGLWGWAKTASAEVNGDGVTINLVCPGPHATERVEEVGRARDGGIGDPASFGRIVTFMCSAHTSFVTGTTLVVDGGQVLGL